MNGGAAANDRDSDFRCTKSRTVVLPAPVRSRRATKEFRRKQGTASESNPNLTELRGRITSERWPSPLETQMGRLNNNAHVLVERNDLQKRDL